MVQKGRLTLWLGAEKGAVLERRLVAEGVSEAISSGYDLRLVADLAADDPAGTALPDGRLGLYRAVLARVVRDVDAAVAAVVDALDAGGEQDEPTAAAVGRFFTFAGDRANAARAVEAIERLA